MRDIVATTLIFGLEIAAVLVFGYLLLFVADACDPDDDDDV